jgi:hypothetical protein
VGSICVRDRHLLVFQMRCGEGAKRKQAGLQRESEALQERLGKQEAEKAAVQEQVRATRCGSTRCLISKCLAVLLFVTQADVGWVGQEMWGMLYDAWWLAESVRVGPCRSSWASRRQKRQQCRSRCVHSGHCLNHQDLWVISGLQTDIC